MEEMELEKVYNFQVIIIFINCFFSCQDWFDVVYKNEEVKWKVVVLECEELY